jgi:ribosomal-protein-alanine N-acetyltransferase
MELVLKSERLVLRPLAREDLDLCLEMQTDPAVMRYVGDVRAREWVVAQLPLFLRRCAGGAVGVWCVTDRTDGAKLGTGILLPLPIDDEVRNWDLVAGEGLPEGEIEVGYLLKPSAWGRGYATEVCGRLLRFAFEETALPAVVAVTDPDNAASQKVLGKCGLRGEGLRRAYGEQITGFRITRAQWRGGARESPPGPA